MEKVSKETRKLFTSLVIGIGEAAQIAGVSARQLRYWEQKGYISTAKNGKNQEQTVRKYSLTTLYKIVLIKIYSDAGYTLAAAVKKAEEVRKHRHLLMEFIMEQLVGVDLISEKEDLVEGRIDFGQGETSDGKKYRVIGIADHGKNRIQLLTDEEMKTFAKKEQ